jgi:two-component system cell cycle response regulator DivK
MASEKARSILMVDNDMDFCYLIDRYIETSQCQINHTSSPEEALALCTSTHPQILLINLQLPADGGWKLMRWIKNDAALKHIPLIVYSPLHVEEEAGKEGATFCLCKPILYDDFIYALATAGIQLPILPSHKTTSDHIDKVTKADII